jgi:hypothetical protein
MTKFKASESWDGSRCRKVAHIYLTADEVAFCLEQCGRCQRGRTDGGGAIVQEYLNSLLRSALDAEMQAARPTQAVFES